MRVVIADAGPLIAVLDRKDPHHVWAVETLRTARSALVTCDAVLTEATHVLRRGVGKFGALLELVERGVVQSAFELQPHVQRVRSLADRYASVPMSFADACLVRMTELHSDAVVWTLDSDFQVYRRHGRQRIPTLMPR